MHSSKKDSEDIKNLAANITKLITTLPTQFKNFFIDTDYSLKKKRGKAGLEVLVSNEWPKD